MELVNINSNVGDISNFVNPVFAFSFFLILLIAFILFNLTTMFLSIVIGRFADKNKMKSAFEFREIFQTIKEIGWDNVIIWYILLYNIDCCEFHNNTF